MGVAGAVAGAAGRAAGAASRGPAVATGTSATSPSRRSGPGAGANSGTGTAYGSTGRAVNSIAPDADLRRSRWWSQSASARSGWSSRSWYRPHRDSVRASEARAAISAQSRMKLTSAHRISSCGVRAPIPAISPDIRVNASTARDSFAPDFGGAT